MAGSGKSIGKTRTQQIECKLPEMKRYINFNFPDSNIIHTVLFVKYLHRNLIHFKFSLYNSSFGIQLRAVYFMPVLSFVCIFHKPIESGTREMYDQESRFTKGSDRSSKTSCGSGVLFRFHISRSSTNIAPKANSPVHQGKKEVS